MEITAEQYNEIQQYIDGGMTASQQHDFLRRLDEDKELRESYEFEKYIRKNAPAIREAGEIMEWSGRIPAAADDGPVPIGELIEKTGREWSAENNIGDAATREGKFGTDGGTLTGDTRLGGNGNPRAAGEVSAAGNGVHGTAGGKTISLRRWLYAAAACLVIVTGSVVYFLSIRQDNPELTRQKNLALAGTWFKKDGLPAIKYDMLDKALADYSKGDYSTIQKYPLNDIPELKGAAPDQRQKIRELGYYYQGISYLATKEPLRARTSLQWVIDHAITEELVWKAQWYQALAFISTSNIPQAAALLRTVADNPRAQGYNQQAALLLQKLQPHGN